MKKLIALVVALILVSSVALATTASFDFSGMSLAQLVEVQQQLTMAMWATEEWQEVVVPAGVYEIGKDIPAGYWTITVNGKQYVAVDWGKKLNESKTEFDYSDLYDSAFLMHDNTKYVSWDLIENTYIIIQSGSVVFTPFTGHSLGFK